MRILVTGGTGYIGSHTCVVLLQSGHEVIIMDNLSNSSKEVVGKIQEITNKTVIFYRGDVTKEQDLEIVFSKNIIDGVIHFAGYKAVSESIDKPLMYYENNVLGTIKIAGQCSKRAIKKLVFSSSATVYGENKSPMIETMKLLPTTNPYGETKAMNERILKDTAKANPNLGVVLLRYFNPVGAHPSGLIGENPQGVPNNLMPYITRVAKGKLTELQVFGNDYPTRDGTGVRDYIHVMDLAEGHVAAIEKLETGTHIYNLGTGKGTSVLELITAFENTNRIKIPYKIVERRSGDLAECYADTTKAETELNWKAKRKIADMVKDAWNYEKQSD